MPLSAETETNEALELLKTDGQRVGEYLRASLSDHTLAPPKLLEAIEYSLWGGGKRLRPALVLDCARACGAGEANGSAMAAAGAIELIHTFSLVHDDLPAMDDDDLRRGVPTNHKVFGEAMAILAGDAMVTLAFELIATRATPALVPALVRELAVASGPQGMIGGQVLDMAGEKQSLSLDELRRIHRLKTGALLTASCRLGAIASDSGVAALAAMTTYGQNLGIAFQIVDDILDVTSTPEQLGKQTNKDASKGKNTYPSLMGLDGSRAAAKEHLDAAIGALTDLGPRGDRLKTVARFVVDRTM